MTNESQHRKPRSGLFNKAIAFGSGLLILRGIGGSCGLNKDKRPGWKEGGRKKGRERREGKVD